MSDKLNRILKFIANFLIIYFGLFLCSLLSFAFIGDKVNAYFLLFLLEIFLFIIYFLVGISARFVPILCFLLKIVLERKYIKLLLLDFLCVLILILNYVFCSSSFMFWMLVIGTIVIQLYFVYVLKKISLKK